MAVQFTPNGNLDICTDALDLPEEVGQSVVKSGAMRRCTNLSLEKMGVASTRRGAKRINETAFSPSINFMVEQGGTRYEFADTSILANESSLTTGLASGEWSGALYNPYNVTTQAVFALNGSVTKKVEGSTVYEWGIAAPSAAPSAANGAGSAVVTGVYEFVYTYARYSGTTLVCESNASAAVSINITNDCTITWVASSDAQVTHVRLYRSLVGQSGAWYFMSAHAVAGLSAAVTKQDADLGVAAETTLYTRPPLGSQVLGPSFGGQLFIIIDNLLYYSLPLQPEYWPDTYYLEVSAIQFPLVAGAFWAGNLMVATKDEIYLISGTSVASYFAQPMSAVTGTRSRYCFMGVKGVGIFHLGTDGIYLYTSGKDQSLTDARFKTVFEGTTVGSIPGINRDRISGCLMALWQNNLWFGYPGGTDNHCSDFLIWNLESSRTTHYQFPFQVRSMCVDFYNNRLLGAATDGYIYDMDNLTAIDDSGTAIDWDIQSKEFVQYPRYFPRYARYDVNLGSGATATGEVRSDTTVMQSHSITVSRDTQKRHIATGNGTRMNVRVYGSGLVDIYGAEVE